MNRKGLVVSVSVKHQLYGCESGCCGHVVYGYDKDGEEVWESDFYFSHPIFNGEKEETFIKELVYDEFQEHSVRIDWAECNVVND